MKLYCTSAAGQQALAVLAGCSQAWGHILVMESKQSSSGKLCRACYQEQQVRTAEG